MPQLKELEQIFSTNSRSPVFPMLANIYYQKKLYKYAVKICKLGLKKDPENLEGLYILAKTFLIQGEIVKAEQILKNILRMCPFHLHSSLLLLHVLETLNRKEKVLQTYAKKIHGFYPSNTKVQVYYKKYCIDTQRFHALAIQVKLKSLIQYNAVQQSIFLNTYERWAGVVTAIKYNSKSNTIFWLKVSLQPIFTSIKK